MKAILSITVLAIQVSAFIPLGAGAEGEQLAKGKYEITCEGAKVTVRANDANTVQLLQEFSRKRGITFNKYVGKTKTVTLDLNGVKVEEFLNRVLGSYVATSKKKNGAAQISKVTIMDEGEEGASPPRAEEKSTEKPSKSKRPSRSSPWKKKRPGRPSSKRGPDEPRPPEPSEQPAGGSMNEPQPPGPSEQPAEEPNPAPPLPEPEQQVEQQPEP